MQGQKLPVGLVLVRGDRRRLTVGDAGEGVEEPVDVGGRGGDPGAGQDRARSVDQSLAR